MATRTDPLLKIETVPAVTGYDLMGNLKEFTDRKGQTVKYDYDGLNRHKKVYFYTASDTLEATLTYTYDKADRLVQVGDSQNGTITRTYDDINRQWTETTAQGTLTYTYDAVGNRTNLQLPGQVPIAYTYDAANRLKTVTQGSSIVTLDYDEVGRRKTLTLPNGVVGTYTYDAASNVKTLTYTQGSTTLGDLVYTYDKLDRRSKIAGSFAKTGVPGTLTAAYNNPANRQSAVNGASFSYDDNGNLVNDGARGYTWNARNQLIGLSGVVNASFQYDALGRRRGKTVNGVTTKFVYDGVNIVQERDAAGSLTATLLTGLGIDEIYMRSAAGVPRYFLTDALGSTLATTDFSGTLRTQYSYEPFGRSTATGEGGNSYQYTGRENDGTGLFYYRARYYHPGLQRFISEDPIGFAGGDVNLYGYAENNPITRIDPTGLDWVYSQSSGQVTQVTNGQTQQGQGGTGYAGSGQGVNNPAMQNVPNVGPIPQGSYDIGQQRNSPNTGPGILPLTPQPGTNTYGRDNFQIHGDNRQGNRSASQGCMIFNRNVRDQISNSGDNVLRVVP